MSETSNDIKRIRKERNLTQKKLGELCGIAESNIRKYENGKQNPKTETLDKIAEALGAIIYYDHEARQHRLIASEDGKTIRTYADSDPERTQQIFKRNPDNEDNDPLHYDQSYSYASSEEEFNKHLEQQEKLKEISTKNALQLITYNEKENQKRDDDAPFLLRALNTSLDAILDFAKKSLIQPLEGIAQAEIKAIQAFVEYTRKDIDETRRLGSLLSYYQALDKEDRIAFIQLLHIYIKMNDVGKTKLYEYSKDIVKNPDNTKGKQNSPDKPPQD